MLEHVGDKLHTRSKPLFGLLNDVKYEFRNMSGSSSIQMRLYDE